MTASCSARLAHSKTDSWAFSVDSCVNQALWRVLSSVTSGQVGIFSQNRYWRLTFDAYKGLRISPTGDTIVFAAGNMVASRQHPARRAVNPRKASKTVAPAEPKHKQRLKTTAPPQRRIRVKQRDQAGRNANEQGIRRRSRLNSLHEWQKTLGEIQPKDLSDPLLILELQKSLEQSLSNYALPLIPLVRFFDELRGRSTDGPQRMVNVLCDLVERIISCVSMMKRMCQSEIWRRCCMTEMCSFTQPW